MNYDLIEREEAPQALRLARWIMRRLQPKSVIDIGCATGLYMLPFKAHDMEPLGLELDEEAVDRAKALDLLVAKCDITAGYPGPEAVGRFDLGLCLEVLEHIPESKSDAAVRNISRLCRTLIFSAAPPGQGGEGHINCQRREHWIAAFSSEGMFYDYAETKDLIEYMSQGYHMGWLINNVIVLTGRW